MKTRYYIEGQELLNNTISGVPVACEETTVQTIEIIILDQDLLDRDVLYQEQDQQLRTN